MNTWALLKSLRLRSAKGHVKSKLSSLETVSLKANASSKSFNKQLTVVKTDSASFVQGITVVAVEGEDQGLLGVIDSCSSVSHNDLYGVLILVVAKIDCD